MQHSFIIQSFITSSLLLLGLGRYIRIWSNNNWASEASPTLGCSIEISRDIYSYVYIYVVGMSVVCQITWNHVNQTRACSKSVLGGKIRPVTPIVFVSSIR